MNQQIYQELEHEKLTPSPLNPRQNFSGPKFDELVASVKEKGVITPILVRPIGDGKFEIIAGERRFRALSQVSQDNGGMATATIPAMVRDLNDDDAFEVMTIENLQREDLTELEEALSFKAFVERKGGDAIKELSERTGINPAYIRRRTQVLTLPKNVLKAWGDGTLKYGHLEQLMRLNSKKKVLEYFQKVLSWEATVSRLREWINNEAPLLEHAKFDLEKEGCVKCPMNSEVQKSLFGDLSGIEKTHCLNPACFGQKQNNWLTKHWKQTGYYKRFKTNGFRFFNNLSYSDYEGFWDKPPAKCKDCPHLVTLIYPNGETVRERACVGDKSCYNAAMRPARSSDKGESKPKAWHGEYFREKFYWDQIPLALKDTPPNDEKIKRLALAGLVHSNSDLHEWFAQNFTGKPKDDDGDFYFFLSTHEVWKVVESLPIEKVEDALKEASIMVALQTCFGSDTRHFLGTYLGLDLSRDWRLNEEYLNKKTIKEIMALGEQFGIFEDKKAQDFLYEKLLKKRGRFTSCKKKELVQVFLESGVDLAGKVPEEILNTEGGNEA